MPSASEVTVSRPSRPRGVLPVLALLLALVAGPLLAPPPTAAQTATAPPATQAQQLRDALFAAQAATAAGDRAGAEQALRDAEPLAATLSGRFAADPAAGAALTGAMAAATAAAEAGDSHGLAVAGGEAWGSVVRGAYAETLRAVEAGDAKDAASWLMVRDFRPTTRFARPGTDATLAVRDLGQGTRSPAATAEAVRADLLDTYQAETDAALAAAVDPNAPASLAAADALARAGQYWALLAPAYEAQSGKAARQTADADFAALGQALATGDAAVVRRAAAGPAEVVTSFRAAPLSEAEQARRAGQLTRYLSLVPVEYGRGVKGGEVVVDLEIQEARAFLDGAMAAFADLRLPLRQQDAAATAAVERQLHALDATVNDAAARRAVADPGTVSAQAQAVVDQLNGLYPAAWTHGGGAADFDVVASLLDQVERHARAGDWAQAEASRLEAYALFETGPEKSLLAFAPDRAREVERRFWEGDGTTPGLAAAIADRQGPKELTASRAALDTALAGAQEQLGTSVAPMAVVFNSATIVFREGLEAVLILASLLASMIGANRRYKKPLVTGALTALGVSAVLFVAAQGALLRLGQHSEQVEAAVSIVAVAVLLLVMNWFFHKVYWTRWIAHHHEKRRRILGATVTISPAVGLAVLGFTSVFREGAETVLFLQSLVLSSGPWIVVQGVALGLLGTAVVGLLTLVLQAKLPHKKLLIVTGMMIALVLVTMVGTTVHTMQLVGWMPIAPVRALEGLPYGFGTWLGIYPTWQGLVAQVLAVVFVVGSYVVAEHGFLRRTPAPAARVAARGGA